MAFLDRQRDILVRTIEGVTEDERVLGPAQVTRCLLPAPSGKLAGMQPLCS
jgi:hypothetical protein